VEARRRSHTKEITKVFAQCFPPKIVHPRKFLEAELLTELQYESLLQTAELWGSEDEDTNPMEIWLGDQMVEVELPREERSYIDDVWEDPDDFEFKEDLFLEDDDKDRLHGVFIPLHNRWTGHIRKEWLNNAKLWDKVQTFLRKQDMEQIPIDWRGPVYRYLQKKLVESKTESLHGLIEQSTKLAQASRAARWIADVAVIDDQDIRIVGCTTTGLTKYRGLLEALKPRVMLIEEAAETREANITSALFPSLEQVILVGDHKQLAPHTDVPGLADYPYNLRVSLFERLVRLDIPYSVLNVQRRMVPEIRQILTPFYATLTDHPMVLDAKNRPPVPGMGKISSFFFNHHWPENISNHFSRLNRLEAVMIARFVRYLVQNGTEIPQITVLTFYTGQRKQIRDELNRDRALSKRHPFIVKTVDGYQGEENDVVILSLVRSPHKTHKFSVGFLADENRAVVALSRAKRGFYIFGNHANLVGAGPKSASVWLEATLIMQYQGRLDTKLPLQCQRHGRTTHVKEPEEWDAVTGGCKQQCGGKFPCGHPCPLRCHPYVQSCALRLRC
jgi:helicase required for RNAi-mediated heterochromatin assembly 1